MSLEKFKYILEMLVKIKEKREKVTDFFEDELCPDSWAIFTFGEDIDTIIMHMLADEFNCWFTDSETKNSTDWWKEEDRFKLKDNDIEYWLYGSLSADEKKVVYDKDGTEIDITSLEDFYQYLCNYSSK